jgi:2-polyprenyl-3-methyl-5-hydroxy-6-metoxy-1,4-benzoquinol methylase
MLRDRAIAEEQMDAADLDEASYARVLADLAQVNSVTLARRPTLSFLNAVQGGRRSPLRILDVGYGDGDMLRQIARWGEQQGITLDLVGIDLNVKSAVVATAATPSEFGIEWLTGDYEDLAGSGFDVILSSLVAHHMTTNQLISFLRFMDAEARHGWFINDLHRHGFAWVGYPLLARLFGWHRIVRQDGQLSIARSYRPAEWKPLLEAANVKEARVFRAFPFRLCVEKIR